MKLRLNLKEVNSNNLDKFINHPACNFLNKINYKIINKLN